MKSTKVVKIISIITLLLITIFGPFFLIENRPESLAFAMFYSGFTWFSGVMILSIALLIGSVIIDLLDINFPHAKLCELLLSTGALIIFAFSYEFYSQCYSLNCSLYILSYVILAILALLILRSVSTLFEQNQMTVEDIVEIGIFVSLAIVLDLGFFKIKIGANGGSISLAMLPLFLITLRKGFYKGFVASGIIFGLITCLTDNYGIITYPFDYLLGFGSIGLLGLFNKFILNDENKFTLKGFIFLIVGYVVAILGRLAAATLSGMLIYKLNFWASFTYQIAYLLPSAGIVLACLIILYKPLLIVRKRFAYTNK